MRKVQVVSYNAEWVKVFEKERALLEHAIGKIIVHIHHIGSTSIPNMAAKPIIDLLIEVTHIGLVDTYNDVLEQLGYKVHGENGIEGRRFFTKGGNARTHHIHMFAQGHTEVIRHLLFRDYLIAHPDQALQYSTLKKTLASARPNDIGCYIAGKNHFIQRIDEQAARWRL